MTQATQPTRVFVDTSVIERANFHFRGPLLASLESQGNKGNIKLLLPSVTLSEWLNRIEARIEDARKAVQAAQSKARILRSCRESAPEDLFANIEWAKCQEDLAKQLSALTSQYWVRVLPIPPGVAERVVDAYHLQQHPFGIGKKRFEFVDAIALETLREYVNRERIQVTVVSLDDDLRGFCESNQEFTFSDSLEATIRQAAQEAEELLSQVLDRLDNEWKQLNDWALDLVREVTFILPDADSELEAMEINDVECENIQLIEADGANRTLGVDVFVRVEGGVSVGHPADPEAYQEWIHCDARIPATLRLSMEANDGAILENAEFELEAGTPVSLRQYDNCELG